MYRALALVVVGCSVNGVPVEIEGGPLIDIAEGTIRVVHVTGATNLVSDVSWASFDASTGDLSLSPPCTEVPGIAGGGKLVAMKLDATDVEVQVQPNAVGACAPKILACLITGTCTMATPACASTDALETPIFLPYNDPFEPDKTLTFTVDNPDPADAMAGHLTTDAPFKILPTMQGQSSFCALAPNTDVIGTFTIGWSIAEAPATDMSPLVSSGEYRLDWNLHHQFGTEIEWCAAQPPTGCTVHRYTADPHLPNNATWCIDRDDGSTAPITIGLRIWALPLGGDSYQAQLDTNPPVTLTSSTQQTSNGKLGFTIDKTSIPFEITAGLGAITGPLRLIVTSTATPAMSDVKIALLTICP